jgi:thiol-disulfide isomerase/thioredoxin
MGPDPIDERLVRRRLRVVVLAAVGAILVAGAGYWRWTAAPSGGSAPGSFPPPPGTPGLVGRAAPEFTLPFLTGAGTGSAAPPPRLSLRSLRGRPAVLNFWASWCAPCREETPLLVRLHKIYGPRGIVFVGVDVQDEAADARRFIARYHVDYPVVISSDDRLIVKYGIVGLPTTVFVDAGGMVRSREAGGFLGAAGERALNARLDQLLTPSH